MDEITTMAAAERLGLTERRVRALAGMGDLIITRRVGGAMLIDAGSVSHLSKSSPEGREGRPWAAATAWTAIALLSGRSADWSSVRAANRVERALVGMRPEIFVEKVRRRARLTHWGGPKTTCDLVIPTGEFALADILLAQRFGLAAGAGNWNGYCSAADEVRVLDAAHLYPSDRSDHTLQIVEQEAWIAPYRATPAPVLIALDLTRSASVRERSAGLRVIREALHDRT